MILGITWHRGRSNTTKTAGHENREMVGKREGRDRVENGVEFNPFTTCPCLLIPIEQA